MDYKLLILDIDGTVTNSEKVITPKTKEALLKLQEQGIPVAIASGRPPAGIVPIADELELDRFGSYILAFNGARIINWKTKECIYSQTLHPAFVKKLYRDAEKYHVNLMTYEDTQILVGGKPDSYNELEARITGLPIKQLEHLPDYVDFPVNKCILTGEPQKLEYIEPILAEKYIHEAMLFRSEPFFLEVTPKNVDKAYCLARLLNILRIPREAMVCCGDGFNDVTMIQFAGLGVAMANAQDAVKKYADYITASNDEDGVAQVVEKFFFGQN